MPRGTSGRIVVLIEPELKRRLHAGLALEGRTLKQWFVERAKDYVANRSALRGLRLAKTSPRRES